MVECHGIVMLWLFSRFADENVAEASGIIEIQSA